VKLNRRRVVLVVAWLLIAMAVLGGVAVMLESVLVPSVMSEHAFTRGFVGLCILVTVVELFVPPTKSQKRIHAWLHDDSTPSDSQPGLRP
jgi:hypothetical protein